MNTDAQGGEHDVVRISIPAVKGLAKVLKRRASGLGYSHCMECVCRSAGYAGYHEALHDPRKRRVSFEDWREELTRQLEIALPPLVSDEELERWYARLFRSAQARTDAAEIEGGGDGADDDIPHYVDHMTTIADSLARPARRNRRAI
jgi:hypothetical protein